MLMSPIKIHTHTYLPTSVFPLTENTCSEESSMPAPFPAPPTSAVPDLLSSSLPLPNLLSLQDLGTKGTETGRSPHHGAAIPLTPPHHKEAATPSRDPAMVATAPGTHRQTGHLQIKMNCSFLSMKGKKRRQFWQHC